MFIAAANRKIHLPGVRVVKVCVIVNSGMLFSVQLSQYSTTFPLISVWFTNLLFSSWNGMTQFEKPTIENLPITRCHTVHNFGDIMNFSRKVCIKPATC